MTARQQHEAAAIILDNIDAARAALHRVGVRGDDVDELIGVVVLQAVERIDALPEDTLTLRGWFYSFARQIGRTHVARQQREVPYDPALDVRTIDPLARIEAREDVTRVVGRFSRAERVLMAAVAAGFTTAEIAAEQGQPEGTIATRVRRIRAHLKRP